MHEKTFAAINKLHEVEIELHRLKNALELANRSLNALETKREWVGLIGRDEQECLHEGHDYGWRGVMLATAKKLKEKNT